MSVDPQLRCLLCDLILAEEGTAQPSEGCRQCGRRIAAGQRQGDAGGEVLPLTTVPRTRSIDPPTVEVPLTAPLSPLDDDIPVASVVRKPTPADIPTIPPARRTTTTDPTSVPYTAKRAAPSWSPDAPRKPTLPPPPWTPGPPPAPPPASITPPRPQVIRALGVLGCMGVLAAIAVVVLVYCVVMGLKLGVKKAEAVPTMTQPAVGS